MKKTAFLVSVLLAVSHAAAVGVSPAQSSTPPPTLPLGSTLYAMDCDRAAGQLWSIDTITGDATRVGIPVATPNNFNCAGQGSYDAVSGNAYFIGWGPWNSITGTSTVVTTVNPITGVSTDGFAIPSTNNCSLTFGNDGTLYRIYGSSSSPAALELRVLDPVGGTETTVGSLGLSSGYPWICAVANNPVDDLIYGFVGTDNSGTSVDYGTVDKVTGLWTGIGAVDLSALSRPFKPDSMAIDSNGIAWIQDDAAPYWGLTAVDLSTGEAWPMASGFYDVGRTIYTSATGSFYSMSIWIVPATTQASPTRTYSPFSAGRVQVPSVSSASELLVGKRNLTLTGIKMRDIVEVRVKGKSLIILNQADDFVEVRLPKLKPGSYSFTVRTRTETSLKIPNLLVVGEYLPQVRSENIQAVFEAKSSELSQVAKQEIREVIEATPTLKRVTVVAIAKRKITGENRNRLARARAKAAAKFLKKLVPGVKVISKIVFESEARYGTKSLLFRVAQKDIKSS